MEIIETLKKGAYKVMFERVTKKMNMRIVLLALSIGILLPSFQLWADDTSILHDRRQVLKYGLDSDVLELVKELYLEKNSQFLPELTSSFEQSQNIEVRQNILSLFLELKNPSLLKACQNLLSKPDQETNGLLLTAVSYLTSLHDQASAPIFVKLLTNKNKTLALASIRALGDLKATNQTQKLIAMLKDPATDDNFKPDIYWALGEMKAVDAVDTLNKAFDAADSDPITQQTIVESLGKIGAESSWSRIAKAFSSNTTSLKAKALQAMTAYINTHPEVNQYVGAGLRDSQVPVRLAAAAAETKIKNPMWADMLAYRVKKDPDVQVRVACAKALSSLPDTVWRPIFLSLLKNSQSDFESWRIIMNISLEKKLPGAVDALKSLINKENKDQLDTYTPAIALELLSHRHAENRALYGLLLLNNKASTRMMALRAISADDDKEYASTLKTISLNDSDGAVRDLASSIIKSWGTTP